LSESDLSLSAELLLIYMFRQLAQLDAAKSSFFSSTSHELRTPLTLISGPVNDLLAKAQDPKSKELLTLASRNVTRLTRLVDSLMQVCGLIEISSIVLQTQSPSVQSFGRFVFSPQVGY